MKKQLLCLVLAFAMMVPVAFAADEVVDETTAVAEEVLVEEVAEDAAEEVA